jgi:hydrogenase/urease accessory protein HupE
MHLLLGVHHPFVWNEVLQHGWGWLLHILLRGPWRGRWCWGTWSISGFFHPFKVSDLREMMSIMAILTTKGTREVCLKSVFIFPLAFVSISPLGVLVPFILVSLNRLVLLGVIPSWS